MGTVNTPTPAPTAEYSELLYYNPVWFWLMSFLVIAVILLTLFVMKKLNSAGKKKQLRLMTTGFPVELDKTFLLVNSNIISVPEACARVTVVLKTFLEQQTSLPAKRMTLTELQAAGAPPKVIESLQYAYPIMFGDRHVTTREEFISYMNMSRAILDGWWN